MKDSVKRGRQPVVKVSINDLLDKNGRFIRPEDLPKRVRNEIEAYVLNADGSLRKIRFRDRGVAFRIPTKRKKRKITKALEREILRRLDEELRNVSKRAKQANP